MKTFQWILWTTVVLLTVGLCAGNSLASLKAGKAELKSAGALAFGPDGILFVGDTLGASIYALDTGDRDKSKGGAGVEIKALNEKIASLLGTAPDQILVNDLAVNPLSTLANGNGMERRFEANSSLESPATITLPST